MSKKGGIFSQLMIKIWLIFHGEQLVNTYLGEFDDVLLIQSSK